jgi:hypothetical protein
LGREICIKLICIDGGRKEEKKSPAIIITKCTKTTAFAAEKEREREKGMVTMYDDDEAQNYDNFIVLYAMVQYADASPQSTTVRILNGS